ncbi:aldo/keto reductase [Streptomyces sp. NPDC048290]|uniref:aldo/keto reductase n=1 Tax=Streptomyces sp. NPDC048290 TaxID=3155811 RepID=UPI003440869D
MSVSVVVPQRRLGASRLTVSCPGLGTATWGTTTAAEDAAEQLRAFLSVGGTLLDTADIYAAGRSEEILGSLLGTVVARSEVVLATKAVGVLHDPGRRQNASYAHLLAALDRSLTRLRTDHVDLWQLHAWDPAVPLEETLRAVDEALSSGRVRYAGVCNYSGWQTAKAAARQSGVGQAPLVSVQAEYSLLERGIEREVVPAAADAGLGLLPWAPLGRGVLTGKYLGGVPRDRLDSRFFRWYVGRHLDERAAPVVEAVVTAAAGLGVPPLAVALAWVRDRPGVTAPLIGARTVGQLRESLAAEAVDLVLPEEIRARLDAVSAPHAGYPETGI